MKATINIGCSMNMRSAKSALASVAPFVPSIWGAYLIGGSCFPRSARWRLHWSQAQLRMLSIAVSSRNLSSVLDGKKRFSWRTLESRGTDRFARSPLANTQGKDIRRSEITASTRIQPVSRQDRIEKYSMCVQSVARATSILSSPMVHCVGQPLKHRAVGSR
jgi:hypothetical protein